MERSVLYFILRVDPNAEPLSLHHILILSSPYLPLTPKLRSPFLFPRIFTSWQLNLPLWQPAKPHHWDVIWLYLVETREFAVCILFLKKAFTGDLGILCTAHWFAMSPRSHGVLDIHCIWYTLIWTECFNCYFFTSYFFISPRIWEQTKVIYWREREREKESPLGKRRKVPDKGFHGLEKNIFIISVLERDVKVTAGLSQLHLFRQTSAQVTCNNTSQGDAILTKNDGKVEVNHETRSLRYRWLLHPHANGRVVWGLFNWSGRSGNHWKPAASIYSLGFYGEMSSERWYF